MLELVRATISYGSKTSIVEAADMRIPSGAVTGLVAPNGWGKTTVMNAISGERELLRAGSIRIDDKIPRVSDARRLVFYAPGDARLLYGYLSPLYHIKVVHDLWGSDVSVDDAVKALQLEAFASKRVSRLSQGMKQQVVLAMAYVSGARYVLLDETLNALDPKKIRMAEQVIARMIQRGSGVLLSSHAMNNIDALCDTAIFIADKKFLTRPIDENCADFFTQLYGS